MQACECFEYFQLTTSLRNLYAGMGVFEYFQLAEALNAEPVWVINNGIAHEDSIPAAHIRPPPPPRRSLGQGPRPPPPLI